MKQKRDLAVTHPRYAIFISYDNALSSDQISSASRELSARPFFNPNTRDLWIRVAISKVSGSSVRRWECSS